MREFKALREKVINATARRFHALPKTQRPHLPSDTCPFFEEHTLDTYRDGKRIAHHDYLAWSSWAARMNETHRNVYCPGCALAFIWKLRTSSEVA